MIKFGGCAVLSLIVLSACSGGPPHGQSTQRAVAAAPIAAPTPVEADPETGDAPPPPPPQTYAEAVCADAPALALIFAQQAERAGPTDSATRFQLGYARLLTGKAMAARRDFEQVLGGTANPPLRLVCPDGRMALSGPVKALAKAQMSAVNAELTRMNVTPRQLDSTRPLAPTPDAPVTAYRPRKSPDRAAPDAPLPLLPRPERSEAKPTETASTAPVPAVPSPPQPVTPIGPGPALVQLGLFSQPASVDAHWRKVAPRFPDTIPGLRRYEDMVQSGSRTLRRLSLAGFADLDSAKTYCRALKSAGVDCYAKAP